MDVPVMGEAWVCHHLDRFYRQVYEFISTKG